MFTYLGGPGGVVGSAVGGFTVSTATIGAVTVATLNGFTGPTRVSAHSSTAATRCE